MSTVDTSHLEALGNSAVNKELYTNAGVDKSLLECFTSPFVIKNNAGAVGLINIRAPEFTSLCPLTGQPDFATIIVDYVPNASCVESKAFKLYLGSFRNEGEFHESVCCRILNDLVDLLDPAWMRVKCEFTPRGGIPFWPTAVYGDLPDALVTEI